MTIGEIEAAIQGYNETIEIQEAIAFWQAQAIAGFSWGGKDFSPEKLWEVRPSNYKSQPEESDEELMEMAKKHGIETPEKW